MFYLKNPIATINTIYQRLQYWLKLSPFWLSLIIIGTITLCLSNQLTIPAYAETQSDNRVNEILREITFCQKDGDTGEFIFGYNHFARCNQKCIQKKQENNWSNWTYVKCAWTCRNDTRQNSQISKIFRAEGYEACINRLLENKGFSKKEAIAACNNNQDFLFALPIYCYDYVEVPKNNSPVQTFFLNLLPECFNLDISATNVVGCVKSIVNVLLVIGIVFLFTSLGYLAAKSLLNNKGNFWLTIREKLRDLIVGIVLITLPVAIITLIDPNWQFLNFSQLASLNLNVRLKDPLGSAKETCPGDPNEAGVIYSYTFEQDKFCGGPWGTRCEYDIKHPTLAFYNCKVFFGVSREGGHITGHFPIFDIESIKIDYDIVSRGRNKINHAGPRVAAGENGVGIISVDLFGKDEWGFETSFWDGESETYSDRAYRIFTDDYFLFVARVAYYKGNWIAIAPIEGEYKVANLGPDLKKKGNINQIEWKTFESDQVTYVGHAELITNRDFTELYAIFGARGDNSTIITIMKYKEAANDEATGTFEKIAEINTSDTNVGVCYRPTGALDSQGNLHFTCDDTGGSLYYYTNAGGYWEKQLLTNNGVSGVLRIDEKDGIHVGFIAFRQGGPAYMYSSDGNTWTKPIVANEIVNPKYGYTANMFGGVAIHGQNPYLLVAFEYFTNGGGRFGLIMFGAEA